MSIIQRQSTLCNQTIPYSLFPIPVTFSQNIWLCMWTWPPVGNHTIRPVKTDFMFNISSRVRFSSNSGKNCTILSRQWSVCMCESQGGNPIGKVLGKLNEALGTFWLPCCPLSDPTCITNVRHCLFQHCFSPAWETDGDWSPIPLPGLAYTLICKWGESGHGQRVGLVFSSTGCALPQKTVF